MRPGRSEKTGIRMWSSQIPTINKTIDYFPPNRAGNETAVSTPADTAAIPSHPATGSLYGLLPQFLGFLAFAQIDPSDAEAEKS